MTIAKSIVGGFAGALAIAGVAGAADYGPIYGGMLVSAPELRPVEIGTGWYLRADAAYGFDSDYDSTLDLSTPAGSEGFASGLRLGDSFSGGVGIGYRFTEYLRADVTARYGRSDVDGFSDISADCTLAVDNCDFSASGRARTWDLMANAYVDLGTFAGFTPYVGGGIGAVNVDYSSPGTFCAFDDGATPVCDSLDGADSWRFAYALSAGLAYNINRSLTLDVGYRYLNVDGGRAGSATLDPIAFADSSVTVDDDGFDQHTITASVRYSLW